MLPDFFWICENFFWHVLKEKFILLIKILNNWESIHSSFILNENIYLALCMVNTFKDFAVDIISFNLTTKLLYGDNYSHFTKQKQKTESQRD